VAREQRNRGKVVKMGYRKIQINEEWSIWDERKEKLKKKIEGKKKRRRIGEKRYKENLLFIPFLLFMHLHKK
jgi:hypothetical protein